MPKDSAARPRRRARPTAWVVGLAVVAALAVVAVLVVTRMIATAERVEALDALDSATATAETAAAREESVTERARSSVESLQASIDVARSAVSASVADYVPEAAIAALASAADAASGHLSSRSVTTTPDQPSGRPGDDATLPELLAAAEAREAWALRVGQAVRRAEGLLEDDARVAADLDRAQSDLLTAAAARGREVRAAAAEAGAAELAELDGAIAALDDIASVDPPGELGRYVAAAAAAVASAEEARVRATAPVSRSAGGGGAPGWGNAALDDPSSLTVISNKQRALQPADWAPGDLVWPSIPNSNGQPLRAEAAAAAERMFAAAATQGLGLTMISGYRSYSLQASLFDSYVARDGLAAAESYSARPGHSEHQTGLTLDIDDGSGCALSSCFESTPAGRWLAANAADYGFVLRYPAGMQSVTGFIYEPWHFRYVGIPTAQGVRAAGNPPLETYFGLPAAPDYAR